MAELCERCLLPVSMCEHRLAQQSGASFWDDLVSTVADAQGEGRTGPLIETLYHGRCRGCGDRWQPGDLICWDEGEDGWVCGGCAGP